MSILKDSQRFERKYRSGAWSAHYAVEVWPGLVDAKAGGGAIDESKGAVREMCIEDFTMEEELELMREAFIEDAIEQVRKETAEKVRKETAEKVRKETTEKNWNQFREITALICSGMSSAKEIAERFAVPEELIESCAAKIGVKLPLYDA